MLELYMHPLASYCWKVLLALYEGELAFQPHVIDLADPAQRAELAAVSPFARFPVLHDHARGEIVLESSIIIEYLARYHGVALDVERLEVRARDRFFDQYVMDPMGRLVRHLMQPGSPDAVAADRAMLATAYGVVEELLKDRPFAAGDAFTMADCAAAPSLFYADRVVPIEGLRTRAYLERLLARPSMIRVRQEAAPYWHQFPGRKD